MKKLIAAMSLCIACTTIFAVDATIGVFIHTPNIYQNETTKEAYGPAIDYINAVVKDMGYTPVIKILPFPRVVSSLQTGEIDMTLELAKNPEREAFLYYPDQVAYIMKPSLTFLADNKINSITTLDDIQGKTIGFLMGAARSPFFSDSTKVKFDLLSGDDWVNRNLAKLVAGRLDAVFDQNAFSYLAEAKRQGIANKIKTIPLPGSGTNAFVVFSKKSPNGQALLTAYNKVAATGKYDLNKMITESVTK